jgi:cytochrome c-type biogenesis protein CcmH
VAFVLVPLLRARMAEGPSQREATLEVLRGQRREIDADVAGGLLPRDAREEAMAELVERAGEELSRPEPTTAPGTARRPWAVAGAVALALPALAFGLYAAVGNPAASDAKAMAAAMPKVGEAQIVAMVENLAVKVRERPDDVQGWSLLARSMAALGRFRESAEAYEHLAKLVPKDAQVLADWADALGMAQGRTLAGRPQEIVRQALGLDPKNRKALALAATAALDAGDFAGAVALWERLGAELPPDSEDAKQVRAVVAEVGERAAAAGKPLGPATRPAAPAKAAAAAPAKAVSGSVALAPALAAQVAGSETLFIFARSEGGPRVPLAVVRASARELPLVFALDDSQAMAPNARISGAEALRVEARISRSGNATPQPGDLVGTSAVVKPGARDVKVLVDKVVP